MFIKLKETYPDRYAPCSNRIRYISEVVIEAARKQTNPRSDPQPRKIQIQGYIENIKETNLPSEIIQYIVNFLEARLDTRGTTQQAYKKILSPDFTSTQEDGYEDYQDPEDRTAHTIDSSNRLNNNRNKMKNYIPQESHSQMVGSVNSDLPRDNSKPCHECRQVRKLLFWDDQRASLAQEPPDDDEANPDLYEL